jgi:hypothetical protein
VHQDSVVKVSAMLEMYEELGTPKNLKRREALASTGDHVIGSPIKSKDVESVQKRIEEFFTSVLSIQKPAK